MTFDLGGFVPIQEGVRDVAPRFDPQPFHLDEEATSGSLLGRLMASGLHTTSPAFGRLIRSGSLADANLCAVGAEPSWPTPLLPDEQVTRRSSSGRCSPAAASQALALRGCAMGSAGGATT
jgi:acyl dehydratase